MKIDNLKQLKALVSLCRKTGVDVIKVDGIEIQLGVEPYKESTYKASPKIETPTYAPGGITEQTPVKSGYQELTEEQILFWSAEGHESSDQVPS